ncbi:EAL domain-containing protein [Evansella sp. AB-P1]|uniref:bifunctional diguanylate cyclase/phosphodiesterase n=1 Tax=Evansella sp. AB-P1 TaxID=3037653 RepID=UPI00241E0356|nr:GGDEF domain-containing phosphodiesterase [Evansella sp. AB-P1]MDG5789323.1 EAL domain-containing protein [Evansella sp. AB-P1]
MFKTSLKTDFTNTTNTTIPLKLWVIVFMSISIPLLADYYLYPNTPLTIFLLFLIPIVVFSLFFTLKNLIIGTFLVNLVHFIWGTVFVPYLFTPLTMNRILNHFGFTIVSFALALLIYVYITKRKKAEVSLRKSEKLLAETQRLAQVGSWEADLVKGELYWSKETYHIFGVSPKEFHPTHNKFLSFIPPKEQQYIQQEIDKAFNGEKYDVEHTILRADGEERIVKEQAQITYDQDGKATHMIGSIQDITEKRKVEYELERNEERFRALVQNAYDVLGIVDENGVISYNSPSCERIFGYSTSEVRGLDSSRYNHPEDRLKAFKLYKKALKYPEKPVKEELRLRHKNGEWVYCDVIFTNLLNNENIRGIVVNIRDISEHKEFAQKIEYMAFHDSVTQLLNKRGITKLLTEEIQKVRMCKDTFSILFLDLDGFKDVNDTLGHEIGDALLKEIASKFEKLITNGEIARFGGDEFVIVLKNTVEVEAVKVANDILHMFRTPIPVKQYKLNITSSIGIVLYPVGGEELDTLLKNADIAMYSAKRSGKNIYKVYDKAMAMSKRSFQLQNGLKEAIKNEEFLLYFQPRISAQNEKVVGFEALIRWEHPTLGLIPPTEFISIAEGTGQIIELGNWVFEAACKQLVTWDSMGYDFFTMSINISTLQLMQVDLYERLKEIVERYEVDPKRLELEITETAMIDKELGLQDNLIKIKNLGIRISIDDFGTGYSSLMYIQKFMADTLKIDGSFIWNLEKDNRSEGIVSSIIYLAESLNLDVVAEGVETKGQYEKLKKMNCLEMQGFYFSKPLPVAEVNELLKEEEWV